jgi:hypothetical protein
MNLDELQGKEEQSMVSLVCVLPILPGKQEEWRRFCQVLQGSRRCQYEESRQRLGITKELAWLHAPPQPPQGEIVVVCLEAEHPQQVLSQLAASDLSFDRWFRQQLLELHGLDVTQAPPGLANELVFVWKKS